MLVFGPDMFFTLSCGTGHSIPRTLPMIKEFKTGGALSLDESDEIPKPETLRRNLQWLQVSLFKICS